MTRQPIECEGGPSFASRLGPVVAAFGLVSLCVSATELDIASLSLDELMEVEVTTPGKVPESIRDTPASVYLIGRQDIENFGYNSLSEVFENVPGFYNIDNYNGAPGNFGVRGFWNGRSQNSSIAILVNGVPQMRPDFYAHPMENLNIPVEAIDRIEISRGPNSVIYGNGASFGAINIITDESFNENQFSVTGGSNGTYRAAGRYADFGDDYHFVINAGYHESDGLDGDLLDMASLSRQALLPGFGIQAGNTSLANRLEQEGNYFQFAGEWRQFYADYSRNESTVEFFSGYPSVEGGNVRDSLRQHITLGANLNFGDAYSIDTRVSHERFESEAIYDALFPGFVGSNSREYRNTEVEALFTYNPGESLNLVAGANFQRMEDFDEHTHVPALGLLNEAVIIPKRDLRSLFVQANFDVTKTLRLVAGYRYETLLEFSRFLYLNNDSLDGPPSVSGVKGGFENGTPRVSAIFQPNQANVFKLMLGDATKIPNFSDLEFNTEKTRTVEFNYTWSSESTLLSASVFRNSLRDLLIEELVILDGGLIDTELRRGGKVNTNGIELLARRNFSDSLKAELGLTWQDSDSAINPEGHLSYSPEIVAHLKVSQDIGDGVFTVTGRWIDEMLPFYNSSPMSNFLFDGNYFGQEIDSYAVFDINYRLDDFWGEAYLSVGVKNVFDTEIRYPNNPINGLLLDRGQLGPERGVMLKLGFDY